MIQTAGTKTKARNYIRGPDAPANALKLNAKHLPNPHSALKSTLDDRERVRRAREYLTDVCPDKLHKLVRLGCRAIEEGRPVVVTCLFGRDRSRVVAEMIGEQFHCSRVYYVHREDA